MIDNSEHSTRIHKPLPTTPGCIHYEMRFTRDQDLIGQYRQLRQRLYGIDRRFIGFREFTNTAAENYEDPDDQMLILHDENHVYGGACLRISTPRHPIILNSEQDIMPPPGKFYFSLREQLPKMELDKYAYSEFVRIVIDPRLRKGVAVRELYRAALERCLDYRVRYMFGIADKIRTRLYRQIYRNAGMEGSTISMNIPMREEYEGVEMDLIYVDMKKRYATLGDQDAACLLEPLDDFAFY
ncbi:MAG: hypothetical protein ACLP9L_03800 [Thermoguttaceae bacterium]